MLGYTIVILCLSLGIGQECGSCLIYDGDICFVVVEYGYHDL